MDNFNQFDFTDEIAGNKLLFQTRGSFIDTQWYFTKKQWNFTKVKE